MDAPMQGEVRQQRARVGDAEEDDLGAIRAVNGAVI